MSVEDNLALNPGLNPQALQIGSVIRIWASEAYEGGVRNF
jgi:hypothetical protein